MATPAVTTRIGLESIAPKPVARGAQGRSAEAATASDRAESAVAVRAVFQEVVDRMDAVKDAVLDFGQARLSYLVSQPPEVTEAAATQEGAPTALDLAALQRAVQALDAAPEAAKAPAEPRDATDFGTLGMIQRPPPEEVAPVAAAAMQAWAGSLMRAVQAGAQSEEPTVQRTGARVQEALRAELPENGAYPTLDSIGVRAKRPDESAFISALEDSPEAVSALLNTGPGAQIREAVDSLYVDPATGTLADDGLEPSVRGLRAEMDAADRLLERASDEVSTRLQGVDRGLRVLSATRSALAGAWAS